MQQQNRRDSISDVRKKEIAQKCTLIFYGLPVGRNNVDDALIKGNQSLAQVVTNRLVSITNGAEELKFATHCVITFLKETKGKTVEKIKPYGSLKELHESGIVDSNGVMILKGRKKLY